MKRVLFHLELVATVHEVSYQPAVYEWLLRRQVEVPSFDLDNFSDELSIGHAMDLLHRTEKTVVVITSLSKEASLGKARAFLEAVIAKPDSYIIVVGGVHSMVNRMIALLPPDHVHHVNHLTEAQTFLNTLLTG